MKLNIQWKKVLYGITLIVIWLMPKDQAYIRQLFHNKGIKEEPTYQRYTEEYIW